MENQIIVSVCIVVYNHEKYLSQAIDSVIEQKTDFRFEIIIGDDCSTDDSQEIIRKYAEMYPNIIPVLREKNIGAPHNEFDLAIRAKGKYIAWLEGDDYWTDKDKLQKQVDFLEQHKEFFSIASMSKIVDENNRSLPCNHYDSDEIITLHNYNKIEMPNIGSYTFHNFFISESERNHLAKIYFSHSIITDWTLYLFFLDKSDIYVMNPPMHCYRKVLRKDSDNFNSIYRLKKNRYDVIVERMEYEQALNQFDWKRLNIHYKMQTKAAELWFQIIIDRNKKSREYGKKIYKEKFRKSLTRFERFLVPYKVFSFLMYHLRIKIRQLFLRLVTNNETNSIVK